MREEWRRIQRLSPREHEVLQLLSKGLSNAEIGDALGISRFTAKAHVAGLIRKLEVSNRTEAVGLARAHSESRAPVQAQVPAIAVLPLFVDCVDPIERSLADAFVDDLITHLGRRWFPVIARSSSFSFTPAERTDPPRIGRALDAQFLVEGSLQRVDRDLRLNVRLVEVSSQHVLWCDSLTCGMQRLLAAQAELTSAIAATISTRAIEASSAVVADHDIPQLAPWQIAARGMKAFWEGSREQHRIAQGLFQEALERDAGLRLAHYGLALTHQREVVEQWTKSVEQARDDLARVTSQFMHRHPSDPWASLMSAYVSIYSGRREEAIDHVGYAISQEPSSVRGRSLHGQLLAMGGKVQPAVEEIGKAIRLSPRAPDRWSLECVMGLAHFAGTDYEKAITWASKSIATKDASAMPYGLLTSSYAHLGRMREAKAALATLQERQHSYSERNFGPTIASTDPEIADRYLGGIQRAATA